GTKFGKTEAGTIWLDAELTKPYEFYQYWLNTDDRDAVRYLKFFTFLPQDQIRELEAASANEPERRHAQRTLAREVTTLVHGSQALQAAEAATAALFNQTVDALTLEQIRNTLANVPSVFIAWAAEWPVVDLLATAGVTASKGEATRLIRGGGIYVNDRRVTDEKERLRPDQAIDGQVFVVRKGKKDNFLVNIVRG
ncbi:MAG: tyrosine--tRNA ligase, partial [Gammaproteobacteria bacterium]